VIFASAEIVNGPVVLMAVRLATADGSTGASVRFKCTTKGLAAPVFAALMDAASPK